MKKVFIYGAGAALAFGLASCSNDIEPGNPAGGNVTLKVQLPGDLGTRAAIGDGLQADKLEYAVYDEKDNLIETKELSFKGALSTEVSLNLVNGMGYKIAFFAHDGSGAYTFDADSHTFTYNIDNIKDSYNVKDHDSFFKLYTIEKMTGALTDNVLLTRPVAQVNWGTNDLTDGAVVHDNAYGAAAKRLVSKVVIKDVYTTFDMLAEDVTGNTTDITLEAKPRPQTTSEFTVPSFPVENHEYVSLQYVLVAKDQGITEATLTPIIRHETNGDREMTPVKVSNLPLQANYRTNIYGALLTAPANITVTKNDKWGDSYNVEAWNGSTDTEIPYDEATKTYTVSTPAQLAGIAQLVNSGQLTGWDYNVELANDIDLANVAWTPIGDVAREAGDPRQFRGGFDGKGYTIYNLNVTAKATNPEGNMVAGLFGATTHQTSVDKFKEIKNLTIDGAKISSGHYAGALVGFADAGHNITNVTVKNAEVEIKYFNSEDSGDKAGALVGYYYGGVLKGCNVMNSKVTGVRDLGGLVGTVTTSETYTTTVTGNHVQDTQVIMTDPTRTTIGEIIGRVANTNGFSESDNTFDNVKLIIPVAEGLEIVNGTYEVSKPAGLVAISDMVAVDNTTFKGKTIILTQDIDMSGIDFTPIGNGKANYTETAFRGTFDGQNFVIKNLKANSNIHNEAAAGLFGSIVGGTATVVKNVILENPTITSTHYAGGIVGYLDDNTGCYITDCKVIGGTITSNVEDMGDGKWDNGDKVGGIIGYTSYGHHITGCSVEGTTLKAYRHAGAIVGYTTNISATNEHKEQFSGNSAKNVKIEWNNSDPEKDYNSYGSTLPADIFGTIAGNKGTELGNNTATNVTLPF